MERVMLLEEMKMAVHSLGNINTSVLSSGWAVSLFGNAFAIEAQGRLEEKKKSGGK